MAKLRGNIPMVEGASEDWRARASARLATRRGSASVAKTRAGAGGRAPARSWQRPAALPFIARARANTGGHARARSWQHSAAILLWRGRARGRASSREHAAGNTPRQCSYGENAREDGRARASTLLATLRGSAPMMTARARAGGRDPPASRSACAEIFLRRNPPAPKSARADSRPRQNPPAYMSPQRRGVSWNVSSFVSSDPTT